MGIVLTAGYINQRNQNETAVMLGRSLPERTFEPPNSGGVMRAAAASYALKSGLIDKAVAVGGMPDEMNVPVEVEHGKKIAWYAGDGLVKSIFSIPRERVTTETMGDLRLATESLKSMGLDRNLAIISDRAHLFPRTMVVMHLLGYHHVKFYSTEFLLGRLSKEVFQKTGINVPILAGHEGLATLLKYELPITAILLTDLIPGSNNWGSRLIERLAKKQRVKIRQE